MLSVMIRYIVLLRVDIELNLEIILLKRAITNLNMRINKKKRRQLLSFEITIRKTNLN